MERTKKVAEQIKREISSLLLGEVQDPRLKTVTVTEVEISRDLRHAKVHFGVWGSREEAQEALEAMRAASGYIRHLLAQRIKIRCVPELLFKLDTTAAYSIYISNKIEELKNE
jgi:ribosome-binding factor A